MTDKKNNKRWKKNNSIYNSDEIEFGSDRDGDECCEMCGEQGYSDTTLANYIQGTRKCWCFTVGPGNITFN